MVNTILLLRYSDFNGVNTIDAHQEVLKSYGSCWWAKIGKQPSKNYLLNFLNQDEKNVLLYTPGIIHICKIGGIIHRRPTENYPSYYEHDIFNTEIEPQTYFQLLSMESIDISFLDNYVVRTSGKPVVHDLKKTISSYMLLQNKDAALPEKRVRVKKEKKNIYDTNHCRSKKNGICKNAYCVNYLLECNCESSCRKFAPVKIVEENAKS